MQTTGFLKAFWALTKPYWVSRAARARASTLLATVVGLALMMVWLEVQFNTWNRDFYNTFENKDQAEFFRQLGTFTLLAVIWIITGVYRLYFQQMLQIEWRTWLTERFLADWMKDQAHYRMQLLGHAGTRQPRPAHRRGPAACSSTSRCRSSLGLLSAVVTLVSFIAHPVDAVGRARARRASSIPGYMVWVALVYAIAGTCSRTSSAGR